MRSTVWLRSPPSRGRGLKLYLKADTLAVALSPPSRGRGLKLKPLTRDHFGVKSPPSRGRGLKLREILASAGGAFVASFAGAWIETKRMGKNRLMSCLSPPSRGRGLKPPACVYLVRGWQSPPSRGRGLKHRKYWWRKCAIESPPSRGRGLKPYAWFRPLTHRVASFAGAWIETS